MSDKRNEVFENLICLIVTITMSALAFYTLHFMMHHNANDNPYASIVALFVFIVTMFVLIIMWFGAYCDKHEVNMLEDKPDQE